MSSPQQQNNDKALVRVSGVMAKFREKLSQALPKNRNVDQEISSVIATVAASPALQRCTPESIALAAYDAATLGLPVNKLGLAWLVPFGNEAKLQIGYRGYIQLVMEGGFVLDLSAEIVRENDQFRYTLGTNPTIEHIPARKDRGAVIYAYACAVLANGITKHAVMSKDQIDHIRSKSRSSSNGPWVTDYDEMAKKTVIKRLCKLLPYGLPAFAPAFNRVVAAAEMEEGNYQRPNLISPAQARELMAPAEPIDIASHEVEEEDLGEVDPQPTIAIPQPKTYLQQVLALQDELTFHDPKCALLPADIENYSDGQYTKLIKEKTAAIVAAKTSKLNG